jgi:hypothetical protein
MWPTGTVETNEDLLFDLNRACKGSGGGASAEWSLSASKGSSVTLHTSRLMLVPKIIDRNEGSIERVNVGTFAPHSTVGIVKLYLNAKLCRKPETLLRPGKGKIPPDLLDWAKKLAGSSGDSEASWSWSQLMEDDFVRFGTDIPSVASRFILRNGAVLLDAKLEQTEASNDKILYFSCKVPVKYVRSPSALVKVDTAGDDEEEDE